MVTAADLPHGVDVSNHQGYIDWQMMRDGGVQFAIIKASEGYSFTDPYVRQNWLGSFAAGIYRGAYHYGRPDVSRMVDGAIEEAARFWGIMASIGVGKGDVLALDIEETGNEHVGDCGEYVLTFLRHLEALSGAKPLLYSSPGYIMAHGLNRVELAEYGLWLASWRSTMPAPPPPWEFVAVWQHAVGTTPGYDGEIDLDAFNGPIERFPAYGIPGTIGKPPPVELPKDQLLGLLNQCQDLVTRLRMIVQEEL